MTLSSAQQKVTYTGNGVTTTFAIPFEFFDSSSNIVVYLRNESVTPATETLQVNPTHYSISGSNVVMVTAPAASRKLVIKRVLTLTQTLDYLQTVNFDIETHEEALDKLTAIAQQILEITNRCAKLPHTTTISDLTLPEPEADMVLGWNATADGLENKDVDTTSLAADITALDTRVDALEAADVALDARVDALENSDIDFTADIAALDTRMDALEASDVVQNGQISALQAEDITLQNQITDLQAQVTANDAIVGIQTLTNGQGTGFDIADIAIDGDVYSSVKIDIEIYRITDSEPARFSNQILYMRYKGGVWQLESGLEVGDPTGVVFSVTNDAFNVGRLQYICDNMPGGNYEGTVQYRATPFTTNPADSQTINNNQAAATNITDLNYDGNYFTSIIVDYELQRSTSLETRFTQGILYLRYRSGAWELENGLIVGDLSGVTLSISTAGTVGTVQYTSDNIAGASYAGKIKWKTFNFITN